MSINSNPQRNTSGSYGPLRLERRASVRSLILVVLAVAACGRAQAAEARKPNVLLILADDLGYSDLGCYGGEISTPRLDALAKDGLRFTQFYNTARCWPSRAALLTGYYAQPIRRDKFPDQPGGGIGGARQVWAPLLPRYLHDSGYRNYFTGKWHIDGKTINEGFDRSKEIRNPGNYFTTKGTLVNDVPIKPVADPPGHYSTIATADHAIECLKDHAEKHAAEPFFSYVAFHAPHFPLHALPEDIAKYRDKYLAGWDDMRAKRFARQKEMGLVETALSPLEHDVGPPHASPESIKKLGSGEIALPLDWNELTAEQKRFQATKMAIHAAMVDRMDAEIGRILDQLKTMGAYDDTLILFASDNGASAEILVRDGGHDPQAEPGSAATYLCLGPGFSSACNTPHRRHKVWVHEGGISTPLIAHWPKGITAHGELRRTPAHVVDIVPTLLDVAGAKKPAEIQGVPIPAAHGKSLFPAFAKDERIVRDSLWWLHEGHRAIRVDDWKLVALEGKPWELYDLRTDRAEQKNLVAKMPEKAAELEQLWQRQADEYRATAKEPARGKSAK